MRSSGSRRSKTGDIRCPDTGERTDPLDFMLSATRRQPTPPAAPVAKWRDIFLLNPCGPCYTGVMQPESALEIQIAQYRQMTGEQRLALALELHELACDLSRAGIKA